MIHFGYERMSNKLSVNSNAKLNKTQAFQRGGRGAGAPPAFQLGEQGEQKCPF